MKLNRGQHDEATVLRQIVQAGKSLTDGLENPEIIKGLRCRGIKQKLLSWIHGVKIKVKCWLPMKQVEAERLAKDDDEAR